MSETSTSTTESLEICRKIEIGTDIWDIVAGKFESFGNFTLGNLNGRIKFYPNGKNEDSDNTALFVVLKPTTYMYSPTNDVNRKVSVIFKCGSVFRSLCKNASSFEGGGHGYPQFASISYVKSNPLIYVTIKMNNDPKFVAPLSYELPLKEQQELMYKFSTKDGDITLIISNDSDNDDLSIQSEPAKKKRRLNNNNSNNNNSNNDQNENDEIKVSGIILKSASPVFKSILTNNMIEKNENNITVYAKDTKSVDDMIYFMCTNKLRDNANAINVMELAHFYQMDRLKYVCINRMINNISIDNFVDTINIFDRYSIKDGYLTLVQFAKDNIDELQECDNFDELSHPFKMMAFA